MKSRYHIVVLAMFCLSELLVSQTSVVRGRQQFLQRLVSAAIERTHHSVRYDPAYVRIPYPGGDIPADTGNGLWDTPTATLTIAARRT